jgi:hypothetical protein
MFLHMVCHIERFKFIHNTFRRSMGTISCCFSLVLYAIGELREDMIKAPSGQTPPKIVKTFRWMPYFYVNTCIAFTHGLTCLSMVQKHDFILFHFA